VLETGKEKNCKTWLGAAEVQLGLAHPTVSGAPGWFPVNWPLSGKVWQRMAIIHRTVRWCTGLSGEPTVVCANGRPRNPRATRGSSNGWQRAPDCPVRQLARSCNGRLCQKRKEIGTGHATVAVRCTTRQKASLAFLDWSPMAPSCLGAIKGTPRRMEKIPKHSLSILRHPDSAPAHSLCCVRDLSSIRVENSLCVI
jgi:hypothetical protein